MPEDVTKAWRGQLAERLGVDTETLSRFERGKHLPSLATLERLWLLRAFYDFGVDDCVGVVEHLAGLPNVTVEDWPTVLEAARWHRAGLDFADALHLSRSRRCATLMTFDDRKFARRTRALVDSSRVSVPSIR